VTLLGFAKAVAKEEKRKKKNVNNELLSYQGSLALQVLEI
jgi:hypothetical protein